MKVRENKQIVNAKRWSAYAVAGAASAVGMATAEQANADSFYSGVLNQNLNAPAFSTNHFTALKSNLAANTVAGFIQFQHNSAGNAGHAYFAALNGVAGFSTYGFKYAYNLPAGVPIAAVPENLGSYFNTMAFHGGFGGSQWLGAGTGYLGFSFISPVEGTLHYGWARVTMTTGAPKNKMTLVDWAYSDDANFQTGQLPEPASLGLLAAGAMGVAMWRRQRREGVSA